MRLLIMNGFGWYFSRLLVCVAMPMNVMKCCCACAIAKGKNWCLVVYLAWFIITNWVWRWIAGSFSKPWKCFSSDRLQPLYSSRFYRLPCRIGLLVLGCVKGWRKPALRRNALCLRWLNRRPNAACVTCSRSSAASNCWVAAFVWTVLAEALTR